jgi:hypothetical protein
MYWRAGPGRKLLIRIVGDSAYQVQIFPKVPQSIYRDGDFIEEPSDQVEQGLRRFHKSWRHYSEEDAREDLKKFGSAHVEQRRKTANKPMMDFILYEYIENNQVKYFIRCKDGTEGFFRSCYLYFPLTQTIMVETTFMRDDLRYVVTMADQLNKRLHEFQTAGLSLRNPTTFSDSHRE